MSEQLIDKIRRCPSLPSMPAIAMQVLELAQQPDVDIAEIAKVISKDPALSSKILRTANSSFYARSKPTSTISGAVMVLGLQSVKTLVLGFSLVSNLTKQKSQGFDHLTYWKRSMYAATASRMIAAYIKFSHQEEAFLVGLLKDIGMLVLDQVVSAQYAQVHAELRSHEDLSAAERDALGMGHADVGGILCDMWKLPPMLATPVRYHHYINGVTDPVLKRLTEIVSLGGRCANVFVDTEAAPAIAKARETALKHFNLPEAECDKLLTDIGNKTREMAKLFEINIGASQDFGGILKKANEALVELTLQTQIQATSLVEQNTELLKKATTDGLTGLNNRATFDQFIAEQFEESRKTGKPLALLMMDVDKFKSINDKHGHQSGDMVLRHMGKFLRTIARKQDLAARYGGEEMCVVLPNTDRAAAVAIAESIRRAIAARPVPVENAMLNVTVSIGVAVFAPGVPFREPAHLLKAADMGVYAAKHGGRNTVRVFSLPSNTPGKSAA